MLSFGEFLVLKRRITAQAVLHVLKKQSRSRPHVGELAVRRGWMTWAQVLGILGIAEKQGGRFGETALEQGMLSRDQLQVLLAEQRAATPRLEDCIVGLGLMEPGELAAERTDFERHGQTVPADASR